jgi:hypothetical protein
VDALDPKLQQKPLDEQKFKAHRSLRDVEGSVNLWVKDPYTLDVEEEQ